MGTLCHRNKCFSSTIKLLIMLIHVTIIAYLVNTNFFIGHQWYRTLSIDQTWNQLSHTLHEFFMCFLELSLMKKKESWNHRGSRKQCVSEKKRGKVEITQLKSRVIRE